VVPNVAGALRVPTIVRSHALTLSFFVAATVGCHADAPTASGPAVSLERVSGDGQTASPGAELERPLVARLVDATGHPVRRVQVRWTATAGELTPEVSMTDAGGNARATWKLGSAIGPQRAIASADGLDSVEFTAFVDPNAEPERIPLRAIALATFDGSDQAVHPDVALPPFDGRDERPLLAITPYPWGNPNFENPSIFRGDRWTSWSVASGVTNPIVRPSGGYLSDPDVIWLGDRHEFWLYYRHVDADNEILVTQSTDGVRWTAGKAVVRAPSHRIVSPTVVRRSPTEWLMWSVNSGEMGCGSTSTTVELRRSVDGLTWSPPTTAALSQGGVFAWHIEVQWIPELREYWALFNGKVSGSCTTDALYLATSPDGATWKTYPSPVLRRGAMPELNDIVYRATFTYDAERDLVAFWHSGARYTSRGYEWRAAFERRRRDDLFATIGRTNAALAIPSSAPPLTNATAP
jgi:hypothetical protein